MYFKLALIFSAMLCYNRGGRINTAPVTFFSNESELLFQAALNNTV